MDRRTFVVGMPGLAAMLLVHPAIAQRRLPQLAMLLASTEAGAGESLWSESFSKALAELGWVEGRDLEIVTRFAGVELNRMPALAAELVALKPDIVLTHTGVGARAVAAATRTIPVVIGAAGEEVFAELAGNFARPTGNVTGLTLVSREQDEKCLELLKQAYPAATRIGVLVNPLNWGSRNYAADLAGAAGALGLGLVRVEANGLDEIEGAFNVMAAERVDAVFVPADPVLVRPAPRRRIIELASSRRLPIVATFDSYVREGGLLSLGTDYSSLVRRAAVYVDKILKGAKPGDLPVERPTEFKLVLNLATARALGIELPAALLLRADEVIE